jgi:hypothetical protein
MTINYENIHQAIAALNQCVKENENKQTDTGAIRVSDLCADVSYFLCKVRQDYKHWQETKDGKMHVYVFSNSDDEIIADLWTCSVPDIDERIVIWKDGAHHHYEVVHRIYGANAGEKVGTWNIYVNPLKKPKK